VNNKVTLVTSLVLNYQDFGGASLCQHWLPASLVHVGACHVGPAYQIGGEAKDLGEPMIDCVVFQRKKLKVVIPCTNSFL
jgi:hypothetical protein